MRPSVNPAIRFDAKVERIPFSGCWIWTGNCTSGGYGIFWSGKKHVTAHRASYRLHVGEIPEGMFVCHKCDVPSCVNPEHLFIGTRQDNVNDASSKGRLSLCGKPGEAHYLTKLSNYQVLEIRKKHSEGKRCSELAIEYHKSESCIRAILKRISWRHL